MDFPMSGSGYGQPQQRRVPRDTDHARKVDMLTQYDCMGPLTRAVISELSPVDLHVGQMLGQCPDTCMNSECTGWDDAKVAEWLKGKIRGKMAAVTVPYSPLVPRRLLNRRDTSSAVASALKR